MKSLNLPKKKEIKRIYYVTKRAIIYRLFKKQLDFEYSLKNRIRIFLQSRNILDSSQIHEIRVKKRKDHIRVYISASKPGLIIGTKGSTIDMLETHLSDCYFKKVIISIKSFDIWKPYLQTYV